MIIKNMPVVIDFYQHTTQPYTGADVRFCFDDMNHDKDDQWSMDIPEIVNNSTTLSPEFTTKTL